VANSIKHGWQVRRRRCGYGACLVVALLFAAILFIEKTKISNGLGEDNVDISAWVLKKGLRKVSAVHLINPHPNWLDEAAFEKLRKMFAENYPAWKFPAASIEDLKRQARYQYTHVPGYNPVDVYALKLAGPEDSVVYFQVNPDGRLFPMLGTELPVGPLPRSN
jgi:hypothetical protein